MAHAISADKRTSSMTRAAACAAPLCPERALSSPAVRELYERHAGFVHGLLLKLLGSSAEADDLLQEVFVVAWKKLDRFRGDDPRPWLCRTALQMAARARRRTRLRQVLRLRIQPERAHWQTPDRALERNESIREVYAILDRLSEKKRTVFILYEIEGLSGAEIAAALDIPLKTVWTRLHHARREFLAILRRRGFQPLPFR